jgi:hypothetical protein
VEPFEDLEISRIPRTSQDRCWFNSSCNSAVQQNSPETTKKRKETVKISEAVQGIVWSKYGWQFMRKVKTRSIAWQVFRLQGWIETWRYFKSQSIRQMYFEELYPMYPLFTMCSFVFSFTFCGNTWRHMETQRALSLVEVGSPQWHTYVGAPLWGENTPIKHMLF